MKHKYKSHNSIRKLKRKKHQILCSFKGGRKALLFKEQGNLQKK